MRKSIRVEIDEELHRRIKIKSAATGISIADYTREVLTRWANEEHPIVIPDPRKNVQK